MLRCPRFAWEGLLLRSRIPCVAVCLAVALAALPAYADCPPPVEPIAIAPILTQRPEIAPIPPAPPAPVARAEIARPEIARPEIARPEIAQIPIVRPPINQSVPCPPPSPIGIRYSPEITRAIQEEYTRRQPVNRDAYMNAVSKIGIEVRKYEIIQVRNPATGNLARVYAQLSITISNGNNFAIGGLHLDCTYVTRQGELLTHPVIFIDVIGPRADAAMVDVGQPHSGRINYTDRDSDNVRLNAATPQECNVVQVQPWEPEQGIQHLF